MGSDPRRVRAARTAGGPVHVPAQRGKDSKGNLYTGETINGRRIQKFMQVECNDGHGKGRARATATDARRSGRRRRPGVTRCRSAAPRRRTALAPGVRCERQMPTWHGLRISTLLSSRHAPALRAALARAHEFKLDALINAFVRIDGNEAHSSCARRFTSSSQVAVPGQGRRDRCRECRRRRSSVRSPRSQQDIVIFEDGARAGRRREPNPALAAVGQARSRATTRRFATSPPVDARHRASIVDQGYVDAHLTYPLRFPTRCSSVRTTPRPSSATT